MDFFEKRSASSRHCWKKDNLTVVETLVTLWALLIKVRVSLIWNQNNPDARQNRPLYFSALFDRMNGEDPRKEECEASEREMQGVAYTGMLLISVILLAIAAVILL